MYGEKISNTTNDNRSKRINFCGNDESGDSESGIGDSSASIVNVDENDSTCGSDDETGYFVCETIDISKEGVVDALYV